MSAQEAKGYRIVDKVITKLEPSKERKAEPARSAEARRMKKRSIRASIRCSFCGLGRTRSRAGLRPVGLHLQRVREAVQRTSWKGNGSRRGRAQGARQALEIKKVLDDYVVGHRTAPRRTLSVAVYNIQADSTRRQAVEDVELRSRTSS